MRLPAARVGAFAGVSDSNRRWWTLAGTCMGLFVLMLDSTVINVALPDIARDLDVTTAGLQWVINAYLLVLAASVISAGRLGDILGRRRVFLIGMVAFACGSVVAGGVGLGGGAGRGTRPAGPRRRGAAGAVAGDRLDRLPGRRARPGAGHLGRGVGARLGGGTARRRRGRGGGQLALAVLAQPALLPARRRARAGLDHRAARRDRARSDRHSRRDHGGLRTGRDRDRARRGQGVGMDLAAHAWPLRDRRWAPGGVLVHRAPRPVADRRVRPVSQRPTSGRAPPGSAWSAVTGR